MFVTASSSERSFSNSSIPALSATNPSRVKRYCATHMSQASELNVAMRKPKMSAWVLADNLRKIVREHPSVRAWAGDQSILANKALARNVSRLIKDASQPGGHSPSLDLLDRIAEKCGNLQAWHLLLPGLDPKNPPVLTMTAVESDLYRRLKQVVTQLPDVP